MKRRVTHVLDRVWEFYFREYKKLFLIPLMLLVFFSASLAYSKITTGEFFQKGVSLKGGYSVTIETSYQFDADLLAKQLTQAGFFDVDVRTLNDAFTSGISGYDITSESELTAETIKTFFQNTYDLALDDAHLSFGFQSATIATTFFRQASVALIIAFVLMGAVVFYYFRQPVSSFSIIFSTLSDIIAVLATLNLLGIKLSVASLGALLIIIGYSADSDVLLATNILKRKDAPLKDRIKRAIKTEIVMDVAALSVYAIMFVFSNVQMIREIALVLLLGIVYDVINTWLGNVVFQRVVEEGRQ
ncbi:hypothetical protein COT72_05190 [archaeon CG10_big_fil_rev_8_21_14_0_10_43_11]|nr:MAG: hypothetical protein COT72_05190 [archaeon CG10_big_fil_rev_8_21_14_0_10_43_11]